MSIVGQDERSITARAVAGDQLAFADLVERHLEPTFRTAMAILGNEADARDVTQEVFVRVWRSLPALQDLDRFPAWLNRIVVNACRTGLSNSRRRQIREIQLDAVETTSPVTAPDPTDARERIRSVAQALDRLSIDERTLLALHHYRGMSLAEIGATIGVPEKTVKSRLHSARRALERALEAER